MDPLLEHAYVKSPAFSACIICNTVCCYNHADFRQRKKTKPCQCRFLYPKLASTLGEILETTVKGDRERFVCQDCSREISAINALKTKLCEAEQRLKSRINSEGYIEQTLRKNEKNTEEPQEEPEEEPGEEGEEPGEEQEDDDTPTTKKPRRGKEFKDIMIARIKESNYRSAMHLGLKRSKKVKKEVVRLIGDLASQEMESFMKKKPKLLAVSRVDQSTAEEFDWRDVIHVFKSKLPVLYTALCYSLTRHIDRHKVTIHRGSCGRLIAGLGLILGMVAKMRCHKFNVIPGLVGMSLLKMVGRQKFFEAYSKTGLCCPYTTSKKFLNRCAKDFRPELLPGNSSLEEPADSSSDMDDDDEASDTSQHTDNSEASDTPPHTDDSEASDASSHSEDSEACDT